MDTVSFKKPDYERLKIIEKDAVKERVDTTGNTSGNLL